MKTILIAASIVWIAITPCWAKNYLFVAVELPPIHFVNSDGHVGGVAVEIIEEVMKNLGHMATLKIFPPKRSLKMVYEGTADAIFSLQKSLEREKFLDYCDQPMTQKRIAFFKLKNSEITFNGDLKAIGNYRIGLISGFTYGKEFDTAAKSYPHVEYVSSQEINFIKLLNHRLDIVVAQDFGESVLKDIEDKDRITVVDPPIAIEPGYLAFSKKKNLGDLKRDFDNELSKASMQEFIRETMMKYKVPY